jgi:GntR family histidine utilization transcriptional repressor
MADTGALGTPLYQQVKTHILNLIAHESWQADRRLPSEAELVREFQVSRMTVNRALRELTSEGYIERVRGVGTFAANAKAQSHPLEILNIAEEIEARGHVHTSQLLDLKEVRAEPEVAFRFDIATGSRLFHSVILHLESGTPIQLEDRYVLPAFAPDYLNNDFDQMTANEYLLRVRSDIEQVEQILTAQLPTADVAKPLAMSTQEPCLTLSRRTWIDGKVVTYSTLFHPASRYQFASRYQP